MECDVFYQSHPPYEGDGDRCSRNEIAAGTATQFSILGMSTTFCGTTSTYILFTLPIRKSNSTEIVIGTWNLIITWWQVKRWGPRAALILLTSIPALRVATQIIGFVSGGQAGIWIIQCTQAFSI